MPTTTGTLRQRQQWLLTVHISQYLKDASKMERVVDNYDGENAVRTDGLATEQAVLWFFEQKRREKAVLSEKGERKRCSVKKARESGAQRGSKHKYENVF